MKKLSPYPRGICFAWFYPYKVTICWMYQKGLTPIVTFSIVSPVASFLYMLQKKLSVHVPSLLPTSPNFNHSQYKSISPCLPLCVSLPLTALLFLIGDPFGLNWLILSVGIGAERLRREKRARLELILWSLRQAAWKVHFIKDVHLWWARQSDKLGPWCFK